MLKKLSTHLVILLMMPFMLAACGFKLKQYESLDPRLNNIEVISIGNANAFAYQLKKQLKTRNINTYKGAPIKLKISHYTQNRSSVATNLNNARSLETKLSTELQYSIDHEKQGQLLAPTKISRSKEYTNNDNQISAKAAEERLIKAELDKELARIILRSIGNIKFDEESDTPNTKATKAETNES